MQSTPAVFCTPAMSPSMSTPCALDQECYPWAVCTPESSPRRWDVVPSWSADDFVSKDNMEQAVPREALQALCAPYFEQMLTVLQQGLCTQTNPGGKLAEIAQAMAYSASTSVNPICQSEQIAVSCMQPYFYEDSTEAESAFSGLFSSPMSEVESNDGEAKSSSAGVESDPASDFEKNAMICRHWTTKGWCKLEDNCKFLHPESKRGEATFAAQKGPDGAIILADSEGARRKKRGGKNRSNRNRQAECGGVDHGVSGAQTILFTEQLFFCAPCTPIH